MAAPCSVCAHEQQNEIDRELIGSATVRDVAGRYGVSKSAVDRHRRNCLASRVASAIARREEIDQERLTSWATGLLEHALFGMLRAKQDDDAYNHRAYLGEARKCVETIGKLGGVMNEGATVNIDARKQLAVLGSMSEEELRALAAGATEAEVVDAA